MLGCVFVPVAFPPQKCAAEQLLRSSRNPLSRTLRVSKIRIWLCPPTSTLSSSPSATPVFSPKFPYESSLSSPKIHRYVFDDTGEVQYVMWYTSRPANWVNANKSPPGTLTGEIRLALSDNGVSWQRRKGPAENGAILLPNTEDWWSFDTVHLSCGSLLLTNATATRVRTDSGVYLMYYTGGDGEKMPISNDITIPGGRTRIGVALSKDGEYFTRIEGQFPSGAILDVADPPSFDDCFVSSPHVLHYPDGEDFNFVMYYHGASARDVARIGEIPSCIGRAVSQDGFSFQRYPSRKPVVSIANNLSQVNGQGRWAVKGLCRPCVIRRGKALWVMFVEVVGIDGIHRIAMCESEDGLEWGRLRLVLDAGGDGEWDAAGVSHPCAVVVDNDELQLFYVGKSKDHNIDAGRGTCIGLAKSIGRDWGVLKRVSGVD